MQQNSHKKLPNFSRSHKTHIQLLLDIKIPPLPPPSSLVGFLVRHFHGDRFFLQYILYCRKSQNLHRARALWPRGAHQPLQEIDSSPSRDRNAGPVLKREMPRWTTRAGGAAEFMWFCPTSVFSCAKQISWSALMRGTKLTFDLS
jgi:hypothetical protein